MYQITFLLFLFPLLLFSQTDPSIQNDVSMLDDQFNAQSDWMDQLQYMVENPANINRATKITLKELPFLTDELSDSIYQYIQTYGPLLSVYELQQVKGIDKNTLRWLTICFYAGETTIPSPFKEVIGYKKTMILYRYRPFPTKTPSNWLGSPNYHQFRIQHQNSKGWRWGLAIEQDAGEVWKWAPSQKQYGPDLINGYIQYRGQKQWQQFIVGNYRVQMGQGLLLGSGFFISKGGAIFQSLRRPDIMIYPVANASEYDRWFGSAVQYKPAKNWLATLAVSKTNVDAAIYNDTTENEFYIRSVQESGYHRTRSEIENRKTITSFQNAAQLRYKSKYLSIGYQITSRQLSHTLTPTENYYHTFSASQKIWWGHSIDFHTHIKSHYFFGEFSRTNTTGNAYVIGVLSSVHKSVDVSISYRHYAPSYYSPFALCISENSVPGNETGLLAAIRIQPFKHWTITGSMDQYRFPWLKYKVHEPSQGWEQFVRLDWKPNKKHQYYYQNRTEEKPWDDVASGLTIPHQRVTHLVGMEYKLSTEWKCRTKFQWGNYSNQFSRSEGFIMAIDIQYQRIKYQTTFRWMYYTTDDYNSRQYMYTPDVAYSFQLPAYYGTGLEPTWILKWKWNDHVDTWFRATYVYQLKSIDNPPLRFLETTWQIKILL
ncbi:MAG: helix-hairpin-helix domain-containing protein [Cytophagaceae bacterium]